MRCLGHPIAALDDPLLLVYGRTESYLIEVS